MSVLDELFEVVKVVCERVYVFYFNFLVGVVFWILDGMIFIGCNVENVFYLVSVCVEGGVVSVMIVVGYREIEEVVVIGDVVLCMFCGMCCQCFVEFGMENLVVYVVDFNGIRCSFFFEELLFVVFEFEDKKD